MYKICTVLVIPTYAQNKFQFSKFPFRAQGRRLRAIVDAALLAGPVRLASLRRVSAVSARRPPLGISIARLIALLCRSWRVRRRDFSANAPSTFLGGDFPPARCRKCGNPRKSGPGRSGARRPPASSPGLTSATSTSTSSTPLKAKR